YCWTAVPFPVPAPLASTHLPLLRLMTLTHTPDTIWPAGPSPVVRVRGGPAPGLVATGGVPSGVVATGGLSSVALRCAAGLAACVAAPRAGPAAASRATQRPANASAGPLCTSGL